MEEFQSYWRDVFPEFELSDNKFTIPNFPEPLMSVDFNKQIQGIRFVVFHQRQIGVEMLSEAIANEDFWHFMSVNYPEAVPFLRKLLPFLNNRKATHYHYFMKIDGKLVASQLVGEGTTESFFFNGVVDKDLRRKGLLRELIHFAKARMKTPKAFFWTTNPWLNHD